MSTDVAGPATLAATRPDSFGNQLRWWRQQRRWSQRELGLATHFSREYVALIERGERRPTDAFAERAEAALDTKGEILRSFAEFRQEQRATRRPGRHSGRRCPPPQAAAAATVLRRRVAGVPTRADNDFVMVKSAVDGLLRAALADLESGERASRLVELERRHGDLLDHRADVTPENLVSSAALGFSECLDLSRWSLVRQLADRLAAVTAGFARLVADGMKTLGYAADGHDWDSLAASLRPRRADPDTAHAPVDEAIAEPTADHADPVTCPADAPERQVPVSRPRTPRHDRLTVCLRSASTSRLEQRQAHMDPARSSRAPPDVSVKWGARQAVLAVPGRRPG